ncbi:MAG TPA: chloride channel protein [Aquabacterium sp.]|uniref:chloride channel protein n=1 Tax=Aquabacterium sp. TaxID=1872578 RepID=UPI002E3726A6|nr:chloride channel protein [Aquabacterium sp.]HEX5356764.1 chloride channel protein [Aquabacterium sp.]
MAAAAAAGVTVVAFTWLTEHALAHFFKLQNAVWWAPLLWTPVCAGAIVWATRKFAPGAAGSGIPQVIATLESAMPPSQRGLWVSLRLTLAKILLTAWGGLAGLSLGREGPSVQIAAGVMVSVRRWLPKRALVNEHGLLVAGGAAGIAAAFNTPLGGVMFAIEELAGAPEKRNSGLLIAGIVLAGLVSISINGNATYFGVIHVALVSWSTLLPGLLVAVLSGLAGGLFSRTLINSLGGQAVDRFSQLRARRPIVFACMCGLAVAVIGVVTQGLTFGSGYGHTRAMLEGDQYTFSLYVVLKFVATWLTTWSGVPGGIFAPALAIGAALGNDVAHLIDFHQSAILIALGMAGFLAAATQAPLTSFIIVMEMVDGHAMVLSLMACALIASAISRVVSKPLYGTLASSLLIRASQSEPVKNDGVG